jgi:hypothetical protein
VTSCLHGEISGSFAVLVTLQGDKEHLTWAPNFFNDPLNLQAAWPQRNLLALQMLDLLRRTFASTR